MKLIPLTQGKFAKVSDHRFAEVNQYKWFAIYDNKRNTFYAVRWTGVGSNYISMHRFIMNTPSDMICDHINHETLDNQDENLRNCTMTESNRNRRINKNNTSGYKGVSRFGKKWRTVLQIGGKKVFSGFYENLEEAARAYDDAAKKHFGEFASLNFD